MSRGNNRLYEYVGDRIRELRTAFGGTGLSQEALAKQIGTVANTVSRWETATYHPSLDDLDKLARLFGVSILDFLPADRDDVREEKINALLRAAEGLDPADLDELRRYAEYRRAKHLFGDAGLGRAGRRRKEKQ